MQNPVAWTLYGLVASNVGEDKGTLTTYTGSVETVPNFVHDTFRYRCPCKCIAAAAAGRHCSGI